MKNGFIDVECKECNKIYSKNKYSLKGWSGLCRLCSNKKIIISDDTKIKISIKIKQLWKNDEYKEKQSNSHKNKIGELNTNWKGGKDNCIDCGKPLLSYDTKRCRECYIKSRIGTKRPKEVCDKIGASQKGEKSHFWKGGISNKTKDDIRYSNEYRNWRKSVYERDKYICQECGQIGGKLNAHHIKSFSEYPELRFDINNGITLCVECHKKTDSYGYKNIKK